MKNYLARLGLPRRSPENELRAALDSQLHEEQNEISAQDAEAVLGSKVTRAYYERAHLQYEAISAALDCLNNAGAGDTHRWAERLIEFDVEPEDSLS